MNHIEPSAQSAISRSVSERTSQLRNDLVGKGENPIDKLFPLFDQVTQYSSLPSFFVNISIIYLTIQLLISMLNSLNSCYFNEDKVLGIIFDYAQVIGWFINSKTNYQTVLIVVVVEFIFSVIVVLWMASLQAFYRSNHRYPRWGLYVVRILFDFFNPLLINPSAAAVGFTFLGMTDDQSNGVNYVPLFILSLISFFVILFSQIIFSKITSISACLHVSPLSSFDSTAYNALLFISSGNTLFSCLFTRFYDWTFIALDIAHAACAGIMCYKIFSFPFHLLVGNIISAAFFSTFVMSDVMCFVLYFFDGFAWYIPIAVILAFFGISCLVYYFVLLRLQKKTSRILAATNPEIDINEYYSSLKINSKDRALRILRTGFTKMCPLFLDMTLPTYLALSYTDLDIVSSCTLLISLFPSESRQLNKYYAYVSKRSDLNFQTRFMLYQISRIKVIRQSSVSSEANEKLISLKNTSLECEQNTRSFWASTEASLSFIKHLYKEISHTRSMWDEGIATFPNSPKFYDEYSRFLVEAQMDFEKAIDVYHKEELLESGYSFSVDNPFKCLVRAFPDFIKKGIMDINGNIKNKRNAKGRGSQNSSTSLGSSLSEFTIDNEAEEAIAKSLLKESKMRMALHHSLSGRMVKPVTFMPTVFALIFILSMAAVIFIRAYGSTMFGTRRNSLVLIQEIAFSRFNADLVATALFFQFAEDSGSLDTNMLNDMFGTNESSYFDFNQPFGHQAASRGHASSDNLAYFLNLIASQSSLGKNVYKEASMLFNATSNISFCYKDEKKNTVTKTDALKTNLKNLMTYQITAGTLLAKTSDFTKLFLEDRYCAIYLNLQEIATQIDSFYNVLGTNQKNEGSKLEKKLLYMLTIPIALFIIYLSLMLSLWFCSLRDIKDLLERLIQLDHRTRATAMEPIRNDLVFENDQVNEPPPGKPYGIWMTIGIFIVGIIWVSSIILMFYILYSTNKNIVMMSQWLVQAAIRLTACAESSFETINAISLTTDLEKDQNYARRDNIISVAKNDLDRLVTANTLFLEGSDTLEPCFGFDDKLDEYNLKEACTVSTGSVNTHDVYRCASGSQIISIFNDMTIQVLVNPDKYQGKFADNETLHMVHLISNHIWSSMEKVVTRLIEIYDSTMNSMTTNLNTLTIVGVCTSLIFVLFGIYMMYEVKNLFNTTLALLKRVPPMQLMANKAVMDFLLNRSLTKSTEMGIMHSVIYSSSDAIIGTSLSGVIELVNPAVSSIIVYTPEQMLGQTVTFIFKPEDQEKVIKQLNLMHNGQSAAVFEDHITCLTDTAREVICHMTILGMKSENSNDISSFVFILSDESEVIEKQKAAEEAKAKSEKLLYQILPRDIVVKLNAGEKDICFSVPSASIIFIDIIKFSDYSSSLTPQEILGSLSMIFAGFDEVIKKYPLLTKIKLIGDVYMAAAGLFAPPDSDPRLHAEQTVLFALDCLNELDEINVRLNASLAVRIGINSGGPVLAGVLGTDKPVFDIIGDPINIAARLQSTDLPGRVQISQATCDLISNNTVLSVERRGEVFLKGKGKQMTYFVSNASFIMSASSDHLSFSKTNLNSF